MARVIKIGSYVQIFNDEDKYNLGRKGTVEKISKDTYWVRLEETANKSSALLPFYLKELKAANKKK